MEPVRPLNAAGKRMLARPLLAWAGRRDTEGFCRARGIEFRHDEMNEDEAFARVRVRRQLLPMMRSFNPRISEAWPAQPNCCETTAVPWIAQPNDC